MKEQVIEINPKSVSEDKTEPPIMGITSPALFESIVLGHVLSNAVLRKFHATEKKIDSTDIVHVEVNLGVEGLVDNQKIVVEGHKAGIKQDLEDAMKEEIKKLGMFAQGTLHTLDIRLALYDKNQKEIPVPERILKATPLLHVLVSKEAQ